MYTRRGKFLIFFLGGTIQVKFFDQKKVIHSLKGNFQNEKKKTLVLTNTMIYNDRQEHFKLCKKIESNVVVLKI